MGNQGHSARRGRLYRVDQRGPSAPCRSLAGPTVDLGPGMPRTGERRPLRDSTGTSGSAPRPCAVSPRLYIQLACRRTSGVRPSETWGDTSGCPLYGVKLGAPSSDSATREVWMQRPSPTARRGTRSSTTKLPDGSNRPIHVPCPREHGAVSSMDDGGLMTDRTTNSKQNGACRAGDDVRGRQGK